MSKDKRTFDLEERLIDFAVRIIKIAESLPKIKVALKELRETRVWLLIIVRAKLITPASKAEPLIKENNELISIFVTSMATARKKTKKTS